MPRISGPELRPDWISTGSAAGLPGLAGGERLAGSVASGLVVRSEMPKRGSSMAGFVCLPFGNVVALGVRCVLGQPRASVVRGSGGRPGRGPSGRWRLAMPGAEGLVGWRDWFGD
ncbi:MAG: hypothetical protein JKY47_07825 [Thalassospira sp.]|uniref:hypothetical protein n=1 Tax=Thalassospira TaxID=168934 RepID=UPI0011136276|nr:MULTISPECIES: hypothetical protein [Thalassospira]MBL4840727.1 hypothetical protein [Thalassospira sp.]MCD1595697.1 hypothetical protein [Thalassospira xiamenensis]QPL35852.1 hypothetical protein IT971_00405 [Thalassospira sp. B30-1]